jgi:hypothetical protein
MITGYGRGWQEPKAHGWRRFFQKMREPATTTDWIIAGAVLVVGYMVISIVVAAYVR